MIGSGRIPANSKSKTSSADSNLGPRCEGSGKTKVLPSLGPRVEARNETRNPPRLGKEECGWEEFCDFEPCLKTNFGTSVNVLPNFSTKKRIANTKNVPDKELQESAFLAPLVPVAEVPIPRATPCAYCWYNIRLTSSGAAGAPSISNIFLISPLCGVKSSKSDRRGFLKRTLQPEVPQQPTVQLIRCDVITHQATRAVNCIFLLSIGDTTEEMKNRKENKTRCQEQHRTRKANG
ncbi:hypothetical protein AVEN_147032-1 [Araneus ventricosus]|uniref:Uncharacterized protein n=1 Tax=Araneus ventricosus TaxID=182803 RepID=A0A4Y2VLK0_ARAVE|nr:hypothetical protein AVEN_147032-1 [Araneus ventricosus]